MFTLPGERLRFIPAHSETPRLGKCPMILERRTTARYYESTSTEKAEFPTAKRENLLFLS
jgi:hypothetical protein